MSLRALHDAWLARLPKGTKVRATFELTRGEERESFEIVLASTCLVSVGPAGARTGTMSSSLLTALEALASRYAGWTLDAESVVVEQAPASAKRSEVKALLAPLLLAAF